MSDTKQLYDSTWLILEKLESVERTLSEMQRYIKNTRQDLMKDVKEAEGEESRGL